MQDSLLDNPDFYLRPISTFHEDYQEKHEFLMSPPITPALLANRKYSPLSLQPEITNTTTFSLSPPLTINNSPDLQYGEVYQDYGQEYEQPMYQFMHGSMDPSLDQGYEEYVQPYHQLSLTQIHPTEVSEDWNFTENTGLEKRKRTRNPSPLQDDYQSITPEGNFKCTFPDCHKLFTKQTNLKSHSRIHHSERNYACQDCGSTFRRSHDLKRHQRSLHSDVKPFPCPSCGKRFSRMVNVDLILGCVKETYFSTNFFLLFSTVLR
jgi:uncharacterized Zn-finger protein